MIFKGLPRGKYLFNVCHTENGFLGAGTENGFQGFPTRKMVFNGLSHGKSIFETSHTEKGF